eukprot:6460738-Lingulodinium_polyedra.AAC.1
MVRASVPHCGVLKRRTARLTGSLRGFFKCRTTTRPNNDPAERRVASAARCATLARAILRRAPARRAAHLTASLCVGASTAGEHMRRAKTN